VANILANHLSGRKKISHRQRIDELLAAAARRVQKVGSGGADEMAAAQCDRRRVLPLGSLLVTVTGGGGGPGSPAKQPLNRSSICLCTSMAAHLGCCVGYALCRPLH